MSSGNPADPTSPTLLEKAQRNDSEAWERLVGLYTPLVYYWCKRIGLDQPDAEEVGQEVFLAVARALPAFDHAREGATFRGWLRVITRRKAIDLLGRKSAEGAGGTTAMERLAQVPAAEEQPDEAIETGVLYRRGVELIDSSFEPNSRQAFWLLVDGMSVQEVSDRLGMTLAAVYTAKSKILKKLREEFRGLLNPDSDQPAATD
jgi:RNA polymerase sigma-70 factor, ECF subfamily